MTFTLEITHQDGRVERATGNRRWIDADGLLHLVHEDVGLHEITIEPRGVWPLGSLRTWQMISQPVPEVSSQFWDSSRRRKSSP